MNLHSLQGLKFGYFAYASKTWLITKGKFFAAAITAFDDTSVNVTSEGSSYLDAAIGTG